MPELARQIENEPEFWRLYVVASIVLSIVLGFGLGAGLSLWRADERTAGLAWIAAAQSHGHVQLHGWAGLMVLGVALHFVPRLAHRPPIPARIAQVGLGLVVMGIIGRSVATIILAGSHESDHAEALRWLVFCATTVEFSGVLITLGALVRTLSAANIVGRSAFAIVAPLGALALVSLTVSLIIDVLNAGDLIASQRFILDGTSAETAVFIAQYGFLLPVAIAMSTRLFPLYIRTRPAGRRSLLGIGALLGGGVLIGGVGLQIRQEEMQAFGTFMIVIGAGVAIWVLGLLQKRRRLPRQSRSAIIEPMQWFAASAYLWLLVAMSASLITGLGQVGVITSDLSPSVQRHSFGAGFVTVLILGVGQALLPGFARSVARSPAVLWATLALGNPAALLRVIPAAGWAPSGQGETMMSIAGGIGATALICFAWNMPSVVWPGWRVISNGKNGLAG